MFFRYDLEKDNKNCILSVKHEPAFSSYQISGDKSLVDLLAASQPLSIFNKYTNSLNCFGIRSALLKRAIVLPNNYELFLSPWLADGSFSYPHKCIRRDWKCWFPSAHNAQFLPGSTSLLNVIDPGAFDGIVSLLDHKPKLVIKNHIDANNYWHWTFDWLPRLFAFKELATVYPSFKNSAFLNIGPALNAFQQEWLRLLFGESIKVSNYSSPVLCENLLWITPPFPAHHNYATVAQIRDHIFGFYKNIIKKGRDEYPSRIYLLRGNALNGRRITNESEIVNQLFEYGFVPVAMDGLSLVEQAQIFSHADIIVGAHGSAFVNMIYCRKTCKIVELFGPGYLSGHDYSLAFTCGLHWEYLEGESVEPKSKFNSDFRINVDHIFAILSKFLKSSTCF